MTTFRAIAGKQRWKIDGSTDFQVISSIGAILPEDWLRLARSRFLGRILTKNTFALLHVMFASREIKTSWIATACDDFAWVCERIPKFSELKGKPFSTWCRFLKRNPTTTMCVVTEYCRARVKDICVQSPLAAPDDSVMWKCKCCEFESFSKQIMVMHAMRKHKAVAPIKRYAFSETCVICLTAYGNKLKLIEHLKQPNSICLRNSFNCCVPLSDHEVDDLCCELANIARLNKSMGWSEKHSDSVCAQAEGPSIPLTRPMTQGHRNLL